jgi:hypothetical protein
VWRCTGGCNATEQSAFFDCHKTTKFNRHNTTFLIGVDKDLENAD